MFNFVFSTGNNDCPQEAMTNIRDRQKKKKKKTGLDLCSSCMDTTLKMGQVERSMYILQLSTKLILSKLFSKIVEQSIK